MKKWRNRIVNCFQENHSLILTIATVVLSVLTLFYLLETRSIRKLAERSFLTDSSPRVFLKEIIPKARFNESKKSIEVTLIFKIANTGKSEALEVAVDYQLNAEDTSDQSSKTTSVDGVVGPTQYLFPRQEYEQETKMLSVKLSDKDVSMVKEAMQQKKPITVAKDTCPPVSCNLHLSYTDTDDNDLAFHYNYEYIFHENRLVYKK